MGLLIELELVRRMHQILQLLKFILDMKVDELPSEVINRELVDSDRRTVPVVFVVEDGKARCTPVRVGPSSLAETIISLGIEPGADVVIGPYKAIEGLKDGDPVKIESGLWTDSDSDDDAEAEAEATSGDGTIKVSF